MTDPRIEDVVDHVTEMAYARLVTVAREKGLGISPFPLTMVVDQGAADDFRAAVSDILCALLDQSGVLIPMRR